MAKINSNYTKPRLVDQIPTKDSGAEDRAPRQDHTQFSKGEVRLTSSRDGLNSSAPKSSPLTMENINSRASRPKRSWEEA